jgi:hypothetical protein
MFESVKNILIIPFVLLSMNLWSLESDIPIPKVLEINPEDVHLSRLVTAISENAHYTQSSVNNESSIKILNEFIDSLDRNKMYFSQSDVTSFKDINLRLMKV